MHEKNKDVSEEEVVKYATLAVTELRAERASNPQNIGEREHAKRRKA